MDSMWFQQALDRSGLSQADLARHLRLAPSAVSRMIRGDRQMKILEAVQTAALLGVSQEEVLRHAGAESEGQPRPIPGRRGRPPRSITASPTAPRGEPIPIRSARRGAADQEIVLLDGSTGFTPRPANLIGVPGAYAIYMIGDAMEPRYQQGWLLHINPFKPPTRGRDVVVYKKGQVVLISQFVHWEGDALVLRHLNPPAEFR